MNALSTPMAARCLAWRSRWWMWTATPCRQASPASCCCARAPTLAATCDRACTSNATDADDWFDTGDLARIDERGYLRITGRSKDVIIRGGENIPVVEVESLLYRHPAIAMAAIVAYPDERLGERACAFVTAKPGTTLTLQGVVDYLGQQHVSKNYLPEHLEVLAELPRTASGKIQKFVLRDMAKGLKRGA